MSNKGTLSTIVGIVILFAVLLVVLFYILGPEKVLPQAAKGAGWIADKIYSSMGQDNSQKTNVISDASTEEIFENILSLLRNQGTGPCIIEYSKFPDNFKDFTIKLSPSEQGTLAQLINKEGQYAVDPKTVSGISPCVIGEGNAAQNFYDNYLAGTPCTVNCKVEYTVAEIEFREKGKICVNGCVNENKRDLDDGNLAFKTKNGNICFFPTKWLNGWPGCDASEIGLDNDCISEINAKIKKC